MDIPCTCTSLDVLLGKCLEQRVLIFFKKKFSNINLGALPPPHHRPGVPAVAASLALCKWLDYRLQGFTVNLAHSTPEIRLEQSGRRPDAHPGQAAAQTRPAGTDPSQPSVSLLSLRLCTLPMLHTHGRKEIRNKFRSSYMQNESTWRLCPKTLCFPSICPWEFLRRSKSPWMNHRE